MGLIPAKRSKIRRFTPAQRLFHLLLMLCFLFQGATGLGRMYMETSWGKGLGRVFGGYEMCLTLHKFTGILMLCGFAVYILYFLGTLDWKRLPGSLWGRDSLLPHPRDLKDFFRHLGWLLGIAKEPRFERWSYWEKFDFWAVFWGIPVLGITGLSLAYPIFASQFMPGWGLNVALWVHRIEAILAMGHVFVIHFFIGHLRRGNFPMDLAMFEGSADLVHTQRERPDWMVRLRQKGALNGLLVHQTGAGLRTFYYLFGYAAMAAGIYLLVGGLLNSLSITW